MLGWKALSGGSPFDNGAAPQPPVPPGAAGLRCAIARGFSKICVGGVCESRIAGNTDLRNEILAIFGAGTFRWGARGRCGVQAHTRLNRLDDGKRKMIILGLILLIIGLLVGMGLLTTIGGILILVGAILWILGATGRAVGGRKHFF
ncbi:hypothetical protein GCM10027028_51700 [Streptomyces sundarbansensis]